MIQQERGLQCCLPTTAHGNYTQVSGNVPKNTHQSLDTLGLYVHSGGTKNHHIVTLLSLSHEPDRS